MNPGVLRVVTFQARVSFRLHSDVLSAPVVAAVAVAPLKAAGSVIPNWEKG